jgi:hypothetical protein
VADAPRLEKLTVIEILDRSFQLYRENFVLFLSVLAVVQVPAALLQLALTGVMSDEMFTLAQQAQAGGVKDPALQWKLIAAGGMNGILNLLIAGITVPLETGALTRAVSSRYLNEPTSVGSCYSAVIKMFWRILGTIMLSGLITMLGAFLCVVPMFIFMVWFVFSSSVVVLEGLAGTEALGRSKQLTDGHRWRVFGMALCQFMMLVVIWGATAGVNQFLLPKLTASPVSQAVLGQAIQQVLHLFLTPFFSVAWILLYYDVRIRKEGFDLEVLARSMESPKGFYQPPPGAPPSPQT